MNNRSLHILGHVWKGRHWNGGRQIDIGIRSGPKLRRHSEPIMGTIIRQTRHITILWHLNRQARFRSISMISINSTYMQK